MQSETSSSVIKLYVGTDHGGFAVKEALYPWLESLISEQIVGEVIDCGATEYNSSDDYPQFGGKVAESISMAKDDPAHDPYALGLLLCRTGGGMAIAANRFPFVRAVVCRSKEDVIHAREHNNCNVLVLEGDHISVDEAQDFIRTFLATPFGEGRHARRVLQIETFFQKD